MFIILSGMLCMSDYVLPQIMFSICSSISFGFAFRNFIFLSLSFHYMYYLIFPLLGNLWLSRSFLCCVFLNC
ncbi:hypothetical protein Hdeb2414_s0018g00528551 [Helianthus debilis subsp. tardiflorus]